MSFIVITLKKCDNKVRILFADTDSLIYEIKIGDVYEDFK